jgi:predicted deacetylase
MEEEIANDRQKRRLAVITIHDAAPVFEEKICEFADELDKLNIKFNIAIIPFYKEEQNLTNYPEFVEEIKSYRALEIALHGLYHNDKKGNLDDFHARSKQQSEVEIKSGLQIITDAGFDRVKKFVPPSWYLNVESLQILEDLEFKLNV